MRLLFLVDDLDRLELAGDTSYALMLEAARRGFEIWTAGIEHLALEHDDPIARARPTDVVLAERPDDAFKVHDRTPIPLENFAAVFMRKDPPVDVAYLHATWILERARGKTLLINDPRGLRELNEHLVVLAFPDLVPPTIVTRDIDRIKEFLTEQGGKLVVKPVDGHGGAGVFRVSEGDPNIGPILETATQYGKAWTMAQRFIPEVSEGDKRIILLDGEPLGAVLRVQRQSEARNNFHAGGSAEVTEITADDKRIIGALAPTLREFGQVLVGIDVIGGRLTEVNVTSPTGIRHIDKLHGGNAAGPIIDWVVLHAVR